MRKWITLLLCLLLLVGTLAIPAYAESATVISMTAEKRTAQPGEELTFTVTVAGTESCKSYGLVLEYDSAVFEITGGECSVDGAIVSIFDPEKGFAVLLEKEAVPDKLLGTFTLRVKEGAAPGDTVISGVSSVKNGDVTLPSEVTSVSLTISGDGAAEETGGQNREEATQSTDTRGDEEDTAAPTDVRQDGEDPTQPEETEFMEHVSATAPVLGDEGQLEEKPDIFLWILIAAGVLCAAGVVLLLLKRRKRKPKGKYLKNG